MLPDRRRPGRLPARRAPRALLQVGRALRLDDSVFAGRAHRGDASRSIRANRLESAYLRPIAFFDAGNAERLDQGVSGHASRLPRFPTGKYLAQRRRTAYA